MSIRIAYMLWYIPHACSAQFVNARARSVRWHHREAGWRHAPRIVVVTPKRSGGLRTGTTVLLYEHGWLAGGTHELSIAAVVRLAAVAAETTTTALVHSVPSMLWSETHRCSQARVPFDSVSSAFVRRSHGFHVSVTLNSCRVLFIPAFRFLHTVRCVSLFRVCLSQRETHADLSRAVGLIHDNGIKCGTGQSQISRTYRNQHTHTHTARINTLVTDLLFVPGSRRLCECVCVCLNVREFRHH